MPNRRGNSFRGYRPNRDNDTATVGRTCEWPGCREQAEYRAPRSRQELKDYRWFCLEHVREYNVSWNYCKGMDEDEIEAQVRQDSIGWRPTWPLGARSAGFRFDRAKFGEEFDLFDGDGEDGSASNGVRQWPAGSAEEKAMHVLELEPPVTAAEVKARYKELVKIYHPDVNGGDKESEERFKIINQAYETIIHSLTS